MPCYAPIRAWRSRVINSSGKRSLVFKADQAEGSECFEIPCGRCIGCRLEYSRQWAIRCVHETQLHLYNCFVTLTFNEENLPATGSISVRDLQLFFKKLRQRIKRYEDNNQVPLDKRTKIKYIACGEYGDENRRPHYHAIIFGFFPFDAKAYSKNHQGDTLFTSEFLSDVWSNGFVTVGHATFSSCAYVSRYVIKKIKGDSAEEHYGGLTPEFLISSRKPPIGGDWYDKYKNDLYGDFIIVDGRKLSVPKAYDRKLEKDNPTALQFIKFKRKMEAKKHKKDLFDLRISEKCKEASIKTLTRNMEKK